MKQTRLLALIMALVLCVSLSIGALAEDTTSLLSDDDILATVNGKSITRGDVSALASAMNQQYSSYGYTFTEDQLYHLALETHMQMIILREKAEEMGMYPFSEEKQQEITATVEAYIASAIDNYAAQLIASYTDPTEEEQASLRLQAEAELALYGYNMENLLPDFEINEIYTMVMDEITKDVTITEEDIQAMFDEVVESDKAQYEANPGMYEVYTTYYGVESLYVPTGFRAVTHILLAADETLMNEYVNLQARMEEQNDETDPTSTDAPTEGSEEGTDPTAEPVEPVTYEQIDAAKAAIIASLQSTIDEINAKLDAGTPFAEVMAEYGTDPGMQSEPTMSQGYSVHLDSLLFDPAFVAGAFADEMQKPGDVSNPVIGSYGVHIIYYLGDVQSGAVPMTDALHEEFAGYALEEKVNELFSQTLTDWLAAADVVEMEPHTH